MKRILLNDDLAKEIRHLYIDGNLSKQEVRDRLNITDWVLSKYLVQYGIKKDKESVRIARKRTCLSKYGADNPAKSDLIKDRIRQSNQLKYGANSFTATEEGKRRVAETKLEHFGDRKYNNYDKVKETKILRYGDPYFNNRDAYRQTMLHEYGVDNVFKLDSFKSSNLHRLVMDKNYSPEFERYISDRGASIELLRNGNYGYLDLCTMFNAPYYVIQNWVTRLNLKDHICNVFTVRSHYEDDIIEFIESLGVNNIVRNFKLDNREIDIYLPDAHLGIEFNGTYWHSDLFKDRNYHFDKSIYFEGKGIQVIHIWQYEWDDPDRQRKIKQLLKIRLGKVDRKIYARQCEIRQISNKEARPFNGATHLQGHRNAKVTYGLFYNNELVQLMSFSRTRYNRNLKDDNSWEIIRGCPGSNNIVVGGVSRLFSHFVKDYNPSCVFSYCDFNKFSGASYEELGMKFLGYTEPDMKYVVKGKVYSRQHGNYRNMKDMIDYRLWGAGSRKYVIYYRQPDSIV